APGVDRGAGADRPRGRRPAALSRHDGAWLGHARGDRAVSGGSAARLARADRAVRRPDLRGEQEAAALLRQAEGRARRASGGRTLKRPSGPTLAALVCSALVALLYGSPVLPDVARTGLDWPIWIDHPEGFIHTNYGKWWALSPHRYLVDGSSGEFPIYYPCLSDSLVNVVAAGLGVPAMSVQAVLFGPLLGGAFLLVNYLSIAAVTRDRRVALVASLLISLGGSSVFLDRPEPVSGLSLQAVL